ncbi:protein of unknown function [Olivibacter domesticus]|uniref:DUF4783 domain-containing protein n=2 Tax=Olivibacter domesticus TaxID=407022 RepID=A0A1H7LCV8_OLID1|nr:protein of unknown function [Olivibacter domesticus]
MIVLPLEGIMKNVYLFLILLTHLNLQAALRADDIIDNISHYFATGNSKELSDYFSSTVSLSILEDNNTYSKNQTEILLRNFFDKNNCRGAKIIHRMDTNANNRYAVLEIFSSTQKFRVSLSLKNFNSKFLITDIRIDKIK